MNLNSRIHDCPGLHCVGRPEVRLVVGIVRWLIAVLVHVSHHLAGDLDARGVRPDAVEVVHPIDHVPQGGRRHGLVGRRPGQPVHEPKTGPDDDEVRDEGLQEVPRGGGVSNRPGGLERRHAPGTTHRDLRRDVEHGERGGVVEVVEDEHDDGDADEEHAGLDEQEDVADVLVGARRLRHRLRDARARRPEARRDGRGDGDVDDELDRPADVGQDADDARGGFEALREADDSGDGDTWGSGSAYSRQIEDPRSG